MILHANYIDYIESRETSRKSRILLTPCQIKYVEFCQLFL